MRVNGGFSFVSGDMVADCVAELPEETQKELRALVKHVIEMAQETKRINCGEFDTPPGYTGWKTGLGYLGVLELIGALMRFGAL